MLAIAMIAGIVFLDIIRMPFLLNYCAAKPSRDGTQTKCSIQAKTAFLRRGSCLSGHSNGPILLQPPPGQGCSRFPRSINFCPANGRPSFGRRVSHAAQTAAAQRHCSGCHYTLCLLPVIQRHLPKPFTGGGQSPAITAAEQSRSWPTLCLSSLNTASHLRSSAMCTSNDRQSAYSTFPIVGSCLVALRPGGPMMAGLEAAHVGAPAPDCTWRRRHGRFSHS